MLHFNQQQLHVEVVESPSNTQNYIHNVALNIQTLTTMLLGYKRPLYLRQIGRLQASDETISVLEEIVPEGKAYFSDYF